MKTIGKYEMGVVWNILGIVFPVAVSMFSIPILIRLLGVEKFGVLTLLWSIVGYFSLFDFGMGRAITQRVASLVGQGIDLSGVFLFGLSITGFTGVIGLLLQGMNTEFILKHLIVVSQEIHSDTASALLISAFAIPITTLSSGFRGLLEGLEDFQTSNIIKVILGVLVTVAPLLTASFLSKNLSALAFSIVGARFLVFLFYLVAVRKYSIRYKISLEEMKQNFGMLNFGIWMTVSNTISPVLVNVDRFMVSSLLGATVVAYYTVPAETVTKLLLISGAIGTSLMPRLAQLRLTDRLQEKYVYKRTYQLHFVVLSTACILAVVMAKFFLEKFLGKNFASQSLAVTNCLIVGVLINGLAYMPYSALQASGLAHITAMTHACELILYLPLAWFLVHRFGLFGAALSWTVRVSLDFLVLSILSKKHVGYA